MVFLSMLAVWRFVFTVQDFDGPLDTIKWARENFDRLQKKVFKGKQLLSFDCPVCLSCAVSILPALYLADGWNILIYWFAIAGGATIIDSTNQRLTHGV